MTLESERGRILPPDLDDRTWQDLVDEMRALIPRYAPNWTDHGPGDIGITLIELFAWLAESVIYRLNRVPEKNYLAFLNLIGVSRDPAAPARAFLTFTAGPAGGRVPAGTLVTTPASETEPPVTFETDEEALLTPANLATAVLVGPFAPAAAGAAPATTYRQVPVVGPPAQAFPIVVPAGQQAQLCLGFDRGDVRALRVRVRLYRPAASSNAVTVTWHYSPAATETASAPDPARWPAIVPPPGGSGAAGGQVTDATEQLLHDGTVTFQLPANWAAQRPSAAPPGGSTALPAAPAWTSTAAAGEPVIDGRFWIGARVTNSSNAPVEVGIDRVLHNAALAHTALTLRAAEQVGRGTAEPFQTFALAHRPLFRAPDLRAPFGHLKVTVRAPGAEPGEPWTLVDDFPLGAGNVFRLDPVAGEISFGDHDERTGRGRGSPPPAGHLIEATYRYVAAGAAGNVAPGRATVLESAAAGNATAVTNLGAGADGVDEEPIEDTLRRAPQELKIRDRAVTADDYEFLAREASGEVAVVGCLQPRPVDPPVGGATFTPWQFAGINRSPGSVNLIIVPRLKDVARPEPTPDLIETVRSYLDQRRDVTAQLRVLGPVYLPITVTAMIQIWPQAVRAGVNAEALKAETERRIAAFLHPVSGGPSGSGWQVGQHVFSSDLYRAIVPSEDIGYVSDLRVAAARPDYFGPAGADGTAPTDAAARPFPLPATPGTSVRLADYELVCAADIHDVKTQFSTV